MKSQEKTATLTTKTDILKITEAAYASSCSFQTFQLFQPRLIKCNKIF